MFSFKHVNFFLPRSFVWTSPDDLPGVCAYIDLLMRKDTVGAKVIEDTGAATDHVFVEYHRDAPIVQLNPSHMIAILRGEMPFEVPEDALIEFDRKRLRERKAFHAWMASPEVDKILADIKARTIVPPKPPEPVREMLIREDPHGQYVERITVMPERRPYFIRRLLLEGLIAWEGTSYSAEGPWKVHREEPNLLALAPLEFAS